MKCAFYKFVSGALLCFLLAACGFHFRGEWRLAPPLQHMYLETNDPYGQLARELNQQLKWSRLSFVSEKNQASTILYIAQDTINQTLLGLNATQQTRQYKLTLTIRFTLQDSHGINILPMQTMEDNRIITIQSNQILGSRNEINLLAQQMHRALATTILERLQSTEVASLVTKHLEHKTAKNA